MDILILRADLHRVVMILVSLITGLKSSPCVGWLHQLRRQHDQPQQKHLQLEAEAKVRTIEVVIKVYREVPEEAGEVARLTLRTEKDRSTSMQLQ